MDIYSYSPTAKIKKCHGPSTYGMINHKGFLALCCSDCQYTHTFVDMNVMGIKEALESEERIKICDELEAGVRSLKVCQQCKGSWGI